MKKVKRILVVMTAVLLLSIPHEARAQFSTIDGANLGVNTATKIQDAAEWAESIEVAWQSLMNAQDLQSTISSAYRLISRTVKDASILRDLYQNYLLIQADIESVKRFLDYIESGYVTPSRIASMYTIADNVLVDAYDEMKYITDVLLDPSESMSMMERLNKISELNSKMQKDRYLLDAIMEDTKKDMNDTKTQEQADDYVAAAFGRIEEPKVSIMPSINLTDIAKLEDPRNLNLDLDIETDITSGYTIKDAEAKFTAPKTVDSIFNVASLLIGIIAVGYTVWNFAMKNSGDRQKQDSQFKVFAGMLIGILLLQALKVMFF